MSAVLARRHVTAEGGRTIKYSPCAAGDDGDEEQAAVALETEQDNNVLSVSTSRPGAANGPRLLTTPAAAAAGAPGVGGLPLPSGGGDAVYCTTSDRAKLIGGGDRLTASVGRLQLSGTCLEQRSTSKGSLLDSMQRGLGRVRTNRNSVSNTSKEGLAYVNKAHYEAVNVTKDMRKQRRKDIEKKWGKKRKSGVGLDRLDTSTTSSEKDGCKWTFVFDPSGRLAYWWSFVVSIAFLYNFWVIVYRFAFEEINRGNMIIWFSMDYTMDLIYVLDIAFHFRTGYLEDGVLQTDNTKLRIHYMNSTMFYIDCLCLLPLDFLYLSLGFKSMLRCFRLTKIYRFWAYVDRTERHTNYPNVVRTICLLHYLFAIYHWNACMMYKITRHFDNERWLYPPNDRDVLTLYLHSLYWSTLTLTTIGDLPRPASKGEYVFVIVQFCFGLLLFSAILGHVSNIVTNISTARKDFQGKLDSVKTYMLLRRVPFPLQERVIKWFDYLWMSKKSANEDHTLNLLPDKLKAEIALHVHLDTLKRVEIFQNTESGFLRELVLKLRPVLFSPQDYICRKGEIGKDMYIVNRGRLQVVADNGKTILATLRAGSYFGEISILNMGNTGNRRTASVRSVGYSDLFCLNKEDLWDVLKDYPTARVRLEAIAVQRLQKYKKQPLEDEDKEHIIKAFTSTAKVARSKSTPGLVESTGQIPLEDMELEGRFLPDPAHPLSRPTSLSGLSRPGSATQTSEQRDVTRSATASSLTSFISEQSRSVGGDRKQAKDTLPPAKEGTIPFITSPIDSAPQEVLFTSPPLMTSPQRLGGRSYPLQPSPRAAPISPVLPLPFRSPRGGAHPLTSAEQSAAQSQADRMPVLMRELSKMQQRINELEAENSVMKQEMKRQKRRLEDPWEGDPRLAEIELHVCDSGSSEEGELLKAVNKESVI